MRLYKRGKTWWFSLDFGGRRHQKTTKEKNRVKAEGIAAAYRTKLAEGRVGIIEQKVAPLFSEMMTTFLAWSEQEHKEHPGTFARYKTSSKPLLLFSKFKSKAINEITAASVEDYKSWRSEQMGKKTKRPIMPATINRELACLKAAFHLALKNRHDFGNPVSEIEFLRENNEQTRVLSFDEQCRYLAAANPTLRDVATLMLETGMRPEEVYRINVANIALDQEFLFIPFGKTKAARRRIPLTYAALSIIKRRAGAVKGTYLFPHKLDKNRPMLKASNAHTKAMEVSKIAKCRLYDLRHTWATRAAEAGMDLPTLAALLGHSKLNMVLRYAHVQEAHQAEAMKRMEKFNAAKQIAEFEKQKTSARKSSATISATVPGNPSVFSRKEIKDKSIRVN